MADDTHPTHLSPSELGTKDYWETFYARTLAHLSTKQTSTSTSQSKIRSSHETSNSNPDHDSDSDSEEDSEDDVDDDSDPGTSWFSEHNAPDKVLQFLTSEEFPLAPCRTTRLGLKGTQGTQAEDEKKKKEDSQPCLLDLGTGNGSMLALLRKKGKFGGDMVGVDYSPRSVELARELQRLRIHSAYLSDSDDDDDESGFGDDEGGNAGGAEEEDASKDKDTNIRFEEWDILSSTDALSGSGGGERRLDWFPYGKGGFDIVLDKGTFDAVSLSEETVEMASASASAGEDPASNSKTTGSGTKKIQRRVCERYPDIARRLVRKGGFLVVTSCNWTEEELIQWFTRSEGEGESGGSDRLQVWGRVEYPRFRFGGKEGQGVCTVCFQRV